MRTRTERWARYRAKILKTPDSKFHSKPHLDAATAEEKEELVDKVRSPGAIFLPSLGRGKVITMKGWRVQTRTLLILKFVLTVLIAIGMVFWWFLWVMPN